MLPVVTTGNLLGYEGSIEEEIRAGNSDYFIDKMDEIYERNPLVGELIRQAYVKGMSSDPDAAHNCIAMCVAIYELLRRQIESDNFFADTKG